MSLCRSLLYSIVKNISNRWFYSRLPERAKAYVSETIEDEQFIVAGTIRMQKRLPDLEGKRKIIHIAIQLKKERKLSRVGRLRLSKIFSDYPVHFVEQQTHLFEQFAARSRVLRLVKLPRKIAEQSRNSLKFPRHSHHGAQKS